MDPLIGLTILLIVAMIVLFLAGVGIYCLAHRAMDWCEERRDRRHPRSAVFGPVRRYPLGSGMPAPVPVDPDAAILAAVAAELAADRTVVRLVRRLNRVSR